jgi:hypothetical protein
MVASVVSKWIGSILILGGAFMNVLNNPELQQYVYPWNLYVNLIGCAFLLHASVLERDKPYILLNLLIGIGYAGGIVYGQGA